MPPSDRCQTRGSLALDAIRIPANSTALKAPVRDTLVAIYPSYNQGWYDVILAIIKSVPYGTLYEIYEKKCRLRLVEEDDAEEGIVDLVAGELILKPIL